MHNECLRDGVNECLLTQDLSISRLACDAPSTIWHLMHHVCDITLRNVQAFDVCLNTTPVSEL